MLMLIYFEIDEILLIRAMCGILTYLFKLLSMK